MCNSHGTEHAPVILPEPADWYGEVLPLEPVDDLTITTICDNSYDMLLTTLGPATRLGQTNAPAARTPVPTFVERDTITLPVAEAGFSAVVTVRKGDATHRVLFDTGISPLGCVTNMDRIGIDPGDIGAVVCSHGHFDHTAGLSGLAQRVGRVNMPVLIHPEFFRRRRVAIGDRDPIYLPTTDKQALEGAGFTVIENRQPSFLLDSSVLITGEVDRTTAFEKGFAAHQAFFDGNWAPDPLILDDQALIVHVRDKGLVILTGCGHSGIVNIIRYAQRLTGIDCIHHVMGGFHLNGPAFEPIIPDTVAALTEIAPTYISPAHCTGWKAAHAIAAALPDAFIPNSVGTSFHLRGAESDRLAQS